MATLREILSELTAVTGVHTALVVGRDGFVLDYVSSAGTVDVDAVGAVVSTGTGSSEVMGREIGLGEMSESIIQFATGIIVTSFVGRGAILAVVGTPQVNLGMIRHTMHKKASELEKAL